MQEACQEPDDEKLHSTFDEAFILNLSIRNYGYIASASQKSVLTTYVHWTRYNWTGEPENTLPITVIIEIQDSTGTVMARIDAEYELYFFTVREVKRDEQEIILESVLPGFWSEVEPFLNQALLALDYHGPLFQDAP